ncbi:MFS transporter [Alicyclobacillus ferrooxydans]|nr:MFS transporter [Alicyclobacillus ferrooxydans]
MGLFYFLFFLPVSAFGPYASLYLIAHGLSSVQIGLILAVLPTVGLVTQPLWGTLVDRVGSVRWWITLCLVVPSIALLFSRHVRHVVMWVPIMALYAGTQAAVGPIVDSVTVRQIGIRKFGRARLFGSIGWSVSVLLTGLIYERAGIKVLPIVYMMAVLLAVTGWMFYPLKTSDTELRMGTIHTKTHFLFEIGRLLKNKLFRLVLAFTFLVSVSVSINNNFYALYYHSLGRPMAWLGVVYSLGALCELPFLFSVGRLFTKWNPILIYIIGASVFLFRWVLMSFEPPTSVLLLLQMLHGVSFSFTYAAGVALANQASDERNRASAQTLYSAVNVGLAVVVGSVVGGEVFNRLGPAVLYRVSSLFAGSGIVLMIWLYYRMQIESHKTSVDSL